MTSPTVIKKYNLMPFPLLFMLFIMCFPGLVHAQEKEDGKDYASSTTGWSTFLEGGYAYQFDGDIDDGGTFNVNRLYVQGGITYAAKDRRSISLAVGYGFDGFSFSGTRGFAATDPWDTINSGQVSVPVRWGIGQKWTIFLLPTLRFAAESGGRFNDSVFGGGIGGFSYRLNDRLTIGPGFGVFTQIEDSSTFFPVLFVKWKITDNLSLSTGRGLGATLGPGLSLQWKPSKQWAFSVGGRYEKLRFRLDKDNKIPGGVGQDRAFPIYGGIVYSFTPKIQAGLTAGVDLGGELGLEDEHGKEIDEQNYDPALFLGFSFNVRF